ncbi:MAG: hypothetical protein L0Y44_16125 [Phycisphaerales bacterium]|nr:hypothetical protein [Phycisphaerales bacterium]MCI0632170.1 hypothetical protein [Phycisphaerales bacterium]MCI0677141.1 hypothetical protein [Phycisphaerales bacterium]
MAALSNRDSNKQECLDRFGELVNCVGIKRFATSLGISTRQVNRILSGAQPNPIERLIRCLQAVDPRTGDGVIDFICQELGGHFVRQEGLNDAAVNAVRECAEAIAVISDGQVSKMDLKEVREAINALSGLILALRQST